MDFLSVVNISLSELTALATVILTDVALAGDNAVVVGMAAAGLPTEQRRRAILIGIAAATGLRVVFALITMQLLAIVGLLLAGGLLLMWVSWKLWREIRADRRGGQARAMPGRTKRFGQAVTQIVLADISMSLDNVLAVAGAARHHTWVLVVGLVLSVALMGAAANLVAGLLERHRWIAYLGLGVILFIALRMIWDGGHEVWGVVQAAN